MVTVLYTILIIAPYWELPTWYSDFGNTIFIFVSPMEREINLSNLPENDIYIGKTDGTLKPIFKGVHAYFCCPSISPDDSFVVFEMIKDTNLNNKIERDLDDISIMLYNIEDDKLIELIQLPAIKKDVYRFPNPIISSQNKYIYFSFNHSIWKLEISTGKLYKVLTFSDGEAYMPRPISEEILAYIMIKLGSLPTLIIKYPNRTYSYKDIIIGSTVWIDTSADGRIVAQVNTGNITYIYYLDGNSVYKILEGEYVHPRWDPTGTGIYVTDKSRDIVVYYNLYNGRISYISDGIEGIISRNNRFIGVYLMNRYGEDRFHIKRLPQG